MKHALAITDHRADGGQRRMAGGGRPEAPPCRGCCDRAQTMGNHQDRDAEALPQIVHQRQNLRLDRHTQRRRRFIGRGSQAMAMTTCWRIPRESWLGNSFIRRAASGTFTASTNTSASATRPALASVPNNRPRIARLGTSRPKPWVAGGGRIQPIGGVQCKGIVRHDPGRQKGGQRQPPQPRHGNARADGGGDGNGRIAHGVNLQHMARRNALGPGGADEIGHQRFNHG